MSEGRKNSAYIYQIAINAIARIRQTQIAYGVENYSRDLYPFRAIIGACVDEATTEQSESMIKKELVKHLNYGAHDESQKVTEASVLDLITRRPWNVGPQPQEPIFDESCWRYRSPSDQDDRSSWKKFGGDNVMVFAKFGRIGLPEVESWWGGVNIYTGNDLRAARDAVLREIEKAQR